MRLLPTLAILDIDVPRMDSLVDPRVGVAEQVALESIELRLILDRITTQRHTHRVQKRGDVDDRGEPMRLPIHACGSVAADAPVRAGGELRNSADGGAILPPRTRPANNLRPMRVSFPPCT